MNDRILARRARFISLALAGCAPPRGPEVAVVPPADAGKGPVPIASVPDPPPIDAGAPLTKSHHVKIPSDVSDETRKRYVELDARVVDFWARMDKLRAKIKEPPLLKFDDHWRAIAGELEDLESLQFWFGYYCPIKRDETDAFLAVIEREKAAASDALVALTTLAERELAAQRPTTPLSLYRAEYDQANPRPCLSVACDRW